MSEDIKKLMNAFGYLPQEVNQGITHEQWRREQRYRFAGLAMQALVAEAAGHGGTPSPSTIAKLSIAFSDALLIELEKPIGEGSK